MSKVTTQVTVPFGPGDAGTHQGSLSIELETNYYLVSDMPEARTFPVFLRLYDGGRTCELYTTAGTVQYPSTPKTIQVDKTDIQTLQGSDSISLSGPVVGIPNVSVEVIYVCSGDKLDVQTDLTWFWDADTGTLKFNKKIAGVVKIDYVTAYSIIVYWPKTTIIPGSGSYTMYGTVFAIHAATCTVASYDVDLPQHKKTNDKISTFQVFRVYSNYLASEEGLFEKPPGWPDCTWYAPCVFSFTSSAYLESGTSVVEVARNHMTGWIRDPRNPDLPDQPFEIDDCGTVYQENYKIDLYCPLNPSNPPVTSGWSAQATNSSGQAVNAGKLFIIAERIPLQIPSTPAEQIALAPLKACYDAIDWQALETKVKEFINMTTPISTLFFHNWYPGAEPTEIPKQDVPCANGYLTVT